MKITLYSLLLAIPILTANIVCSPYSLISYVATSSQIPFLKCWNSQSNDEPFHEIIGGGFVNAQGLASNYQASLITYFLHFR